MTSEQIRRWKLALGDDDMGGLDERDRRLSQALSALYDGEGKKGRGGLGASSPKVSRWLGDIREFFPTPVVQVIQKDAFERLNLKALMMEQAAEVFVLALDGLLADQPSPEMLESRAKVLVQRFARPTQRNTAKSRTT